MGQEYTYTREQFRDDVLAALRRVKPFSEEVTLVDFSPPPPHPFRLDKELICFNPRSERRIPATPVPSVITDAWILA